MRTSILELVSFLVASHLRLGQGGINLGDLRGIGIADQVSRSIGRLASSFHTFFFLKAHDIHKSRTDWKGGPLAVGVWKGGVSLPAKNIKSCLGVGKDGVGDRGSLRVRREAGNVAKGLNVSDRLVVLSHKRRAGKTVSGIKKVNCVSNDEKAVLLDYF